METLIHNISQVLGITILHSLWQGLLVYLLLKIILSVAPSLSSVKKHNISLVAIALMAVWFIATITLQVGRVQWLANEAVAATALPLNNYIPQAATHSAQPDNSYYYVIKGYLPYITVVYLIGLLLNILKLCFAWRNINLVKKSLMPAGHLENMVKKFSLQMNIKRDVLVSYSRMIDVPGVIGFFKPVLLLPIAITNDLTNAEVEAILLHELSHIKRNDYLLNLLQQIISVVLFFNPFALLINRIINSERENCCDDEVVKITGQPLIYARALLTLEQNKPNNLQLALAATGKRYHLLNRIERIMTARQLTVNVRHILGAVLLFAFSLGSIAWLNPEIKSDHIKLTIVNPLLASYLFTDTIPAAKFKKQKQDKLTRKTSKKTTIITTSDDPELERLSKEIEKHGEALGKLYDSPEFKKMTAELEKKSEEINDLNNSPEFKKLLEKQERFSEDFDKKWNNNPEIEKLHKRMSELGNDIETYYSGPAYKKIEKQLEKEIALLDKSKPGTAAYYKHQAEVMRLAQAIGQQATTPEISQKTAFMGQLGAQIGQIYQSDDYLKHQEQLKALSDSISKVVNSKQARQHMEAMKIMSEKMQNFQNSTMVKNEQKRLQEATVKLQAYTNSPAFRKRIQQLQREARLRIPEQPEKVEQPEQPELPEAPEAPEAVDN
ncbi:MAG: M56 family metallopeptidase [Mucilaginibacter sp.]